METMFENRKLRSSIWILNILQKYRRLTLSEISKYWVEDKEISRGVALGRRSFFNYRNTLQDAFGIIIECEKSTNTYYINSGDDNLLSSWIISSFNVGQLVMDSQEVKDRILLDAPPSGMEHFNIVVEAFRRHCCLHIRYQKFNGAEPYECHLQPYSLKLHQQRWYLLAVKDHGSRPVTFALDRMLDIELLPDDLFMLSKDFSPQIYYKDSFGVWTGEGEAPLITLRAFGNERNYLRTLPLHPSQKEVCNSVDYSDFQIRCYPTRDLLLHILSFGKGVEVIAPDDFRTMVADEIRGMAERYQYMLN